MKFCSKCGKEISEEAVVCVHCGCSVAPNKVVENDAPNMGFAILGFFIPVVGLILYLMWKDQTPLKAKSAGKGALIGVGLSVLTYIVYFVIMAGMMSMYM